MVKRCSYFRMCFSTICPTNWLRLATSFQLRGSGGVKLGFEVAKSFSICKRNNSDNNAGQYQWKLRSLSCRTSTIHPIRAAEIPPLLSSVVRYQIRKYSVVCKGQIQDALDASFHLGESLEKPAKLRNSRTKFGVTVNKDVLQDSSLVEEHLRKATKPKKSKRKLAVIDCNEEPIQKVTKSKKTRKKLGVTDSNEVFYRMEFDGASKGNPGKAGAGVVLRNQDGSVICELKEGVGRATNNVAEYRAVILGLKVALSRGIQNIHVQGDSNLVCKQIQDLWKIKSQNIAELCKEAKELKSKFKEFRINHIYREFNGEADALANAAVELKNGEIKNDMVTYRLDNSLEMVSSSQRERSKVDLVDPMKDVLQDSSLVEEHLQKATKPKKSKRKLAVIDCNEESIQKVTKSKKTRKKLGVTDSNEVLYQMEFDGASKGNPGKAGAGVVLRNQDGSVICELKEGVGRATNNVAEYRAVILGLKVALSRGIQNIHVQGDSNLVCKQIQDLWKIKSQNIAELCKEAKELKSKFKEFRINHIYREFNGEADALANAAIELKNGERKIDVVTYQLDNPLELVSGSQRERSKVDLVDPMKKSLKASLPSEKRLEKPLKSVRTSSRDDLLDTDKGFYRLEFDGASKGNPRKAGAGAVLRNQYGSVICELTENLGIATNNAAEYHAIILGLKAALSKGIERIHVQGDSKLVCMQVQDLWAVKSQNIVVLHMEAKKLISKFKEFRISHVYRELNGEANNLANAAIELQTGE